MAKLNLLNERFGKLVVIDYAPNVGELTAWKCKCDCGNECIAVTKRLRNGTKNSCGCLQNSSQKIMPNQKFNLLTTIKPVENKKHYWLCKCDCGNFTEVLEYNLKKGEVKSCGCLRRRQSNHRLDLTNQKFGFLTAKYYDIEKSTPNRTYWVCECECGNIVSVLRENLTSKNRFPSCGCQHISVGENKIASLLKENNISFVQEKTFDTCINPKTNKKLRFDFYVNNSYLIEYDGKQHFKEKDGWEPLEDTQYRDNIKNEWCKENNIPLIRIPYTKLNSLTINDLLIPTAN